MGVISDVGVESFVVLRKVFFTKIAKKREPCLDVVDSGKQTTSGRWSVRSPWRGAGLLLCSDDACGNAVSAISSSVC